MHVDSDMMQQHKQQDGRLSSRVLLLLIGVSSVIAKSNGASPILISKY